MMVFLYRSYQYLYEQNFDLVSVSDHKNGQHFIIPQMADR